MGILRNGLKTMATQYNWKWQMSTTSDEVSYFEMVSS